jgi:hypothetical protein
MHGFGHNWIKSTVNRIEGGKRPLRVNELEDLARMLEVPREMLLTPLSTDTPIDDSGQPVDLQSATAKQLRDLIAKEEAGQAVDLAEEGAAKAELEELEPKLAAARKKRDQAAARIAASQRRVAQLRGMLNVRQSRAGETR